MLAVVRDVTERKKAREALKESERKLRSIVENAPNIIMIIDQEGRIKFLNRSVPGGPSVDEFTGKTIYDYSEPEYHSVQREILEKVFTKGGVGRAVTRAIGPYGGKSWYQIQVAPIRHDHDIVSAVFIATDITVCKKSEMVSLQSKRLVERGLHNLRDAVFILDIDMAKILDCNPAALKIFGYDRHELIGSSPALLCENDEGFIEFKKDINSAVDKEGFLINSYSNMKRKDGSVLVSKCDVIPLEDEQGERECWVYIISDAASH